MGHFKLVKVNTGNVVHLAEHFETPQGIQGYDVYCGSGKTGLRPRLINTYQEVKLENITCKKCQKRYAEKVKEYQFKKDAETMKKNFKEQYNIAKELKRMKENRESFYLAK